MRRIAISSGHGKYIRGARGNPVPPQLDEVDEARRVVEHVADYLSSAGVQHVTFHDNTSHDQNTNLNAIVNWHNKQSRDLDVSVHFNAYDHTAHGVEVLYVTQQSLANELSSAISVVGHFTNRGPKKRTDLFFLNNTSKPAILIETCFCDNTGDSNNYNQYFDAICHAIAETIADVSISDTPGGQPPTEQPPSTHDPWSVPIDSRSVVGMGDTGKDVADLQQMLPRFSGNVDGDFGPITEGAVFDYQRTRDLDVDGVVGQQTWGALYERKPPVRTPTPLSPVEQERIKKIARESSIAEYPWKDRGVAPTGYTQGMALAFASSYRRLLAEHPAVLEMAKARTTSDKDALHVYKSKFDQLGMSNETGGADTLRHLYALMLGSGMRESSGRYCEGRDLSASNVQSDTAEAGLFQTSYNAHSASDPEFSGLMSEYTDDGSACWTPTFADGVSCSSSEWDCYGSGSGYKFQELCKNCPMFAVETHGLTLRNLCNHYGPIVRKEVELREDADAMFTEVQRYLDEGAVEV